MIGATCRCCGFPVTSATSGPMQGIPFADGSMAHMACYETAEREKTRNRTQNADCCALEAPPGEKTPFKARVPLKKLLTGPGAFSGSWHQPDLL